jgi:RNA polymerase sigma factor (sigma-70 family)
MKGNSRGGQLTASTESSTANNNYPSNSKDALLNAVELYYSKLQLSIRVMVAKAGLAEGAAHIAEISDEILHAAIETALAGAGKFDPAISTYSWLFGIAVNKMRESRRAIYYENNHIEASIDDDTGGLKQKRANYDEGEDFTPEEHLDAILYHSTQRDSLEDTTMPLDELLSIVDTKDRKVLLLVYADRLSGIDLAAALGVREGAAYMRVARAKKHLRQKYLAILGTKEL